MIALISYVSMHVLGLGLGVVAGTLTVFTLLLAGSWFGSFQEWRAHTRTIAAACILLLLLGSLHTVAMVALNHPAAPSGSVRGADWRELAGLIAFLPAAIIAGIVGSQLNPALMNKELSASWPFGFAVLLGIMLFIGLLLWRSRREQSPRVKSALFLAVFSAVLLVTLLAMIAEREMQEPSSSGLYGYLVVPVTFCR